MSRLSISLLTLAIATSCTAQGFVERMNKRFAGQSPKAGEMLPDAVGFHADGSPFALQDTRGKLTVLVTGCLT